MISSRHAVWLAPAIVFMLAAPAQAHPWTKRTVGVGLSLGEPTALTIDYRPTFTSSIDLAVGLDNFDNDGSDNGYVHLAYIIRFAYLSHKHNLAVPLYLGIGVMAFDHGRDFNDNLHLGLRIPFGIGFEFKAPVMLFLEVAARFVVVDDHDNHGHGTDLGGAAGFRLYF